MIETSRALRLARQLGEDTRALALTEFALGLPIMLALGCYGIEESNLALAHLRVSQIALELADNSSRVGVTSNQAIQQLREVDINDALQAVRLQGSTINFTTYGRITLSSLEDVQQSYDAGPVQRIHWQRCLGLRSGAGYDSSYGSTTATAGSDATQANAGTTQASGIGDTGYKVNAPSGSGLMFVEVNYDYQPLFVTKQLLPATKIHYSASFIVRDRRDFSQIFNPAPTATASTCSRYTT